MKKLLICCAFAFFLSFGCATTHTQKNEMPEHLLDRLARDMAQINLISEEMRQTSQELPEGVKILEALAPRKLKVSSATGVKFQDVLTSKIQVPCEKCQSGNTIAGILKLGLVDQPSWQVLNSKMYDEVETKGAMSFASALSIHKFATAMGSAYFYDKALAEDPKARSAVTQTIGVWSRIEDTGKELVKRSLAKIQEIRREYHDYLEITGFEISFPWGITLHIKLKIPPKGP